MQYNNISRPVLIYQGSKFRIAPWIISHFPQHKVYVEPFGGSGGVLLRKKSIKNEVYNDIEKKVVNVFRVLRDKEKAQELSRLLWLTPFSRCEYRENTEWLDTDSDIEKARKTICRAQFGISAASTIRSLGGFNTRINKEDYRLDTYRAYISLHSYIMDFAERFREVIIEDRDASFILEQYDSKETLFYCDPPYIKDLWNKTDRDIYTNIPDKAWHEAFLYKLLNIKGMAIISGYDNDLYNDILKDWHTDTIKTICQNNTSRLEKIWISPKCLEKQNKQLMLF